MRFSRFYKKAGRKIKLAPGSSLVLLGLILVGGATALAQTEPALIVSPTSGPPGTTVTAKGTGFPPGAALNIGIGLPNSQFNGSYVRMVADANGAFEVTFRLERTLDGQNLLLPGRFILAAHDADYMYKGLAEFTILPGGGAPVGGDISGGLPGSMPSAGFGGAKSNSGSLNMLLTLVGLLGCSLLARFVLVATKRELEKFVPTGFGRYKFGRQTIHKNFVVPLAANR
jgi:hypothetical protein